MKKQINIVWFKKDLRINDHEALQKAIDRKQKLLLIYIFEPSLLASPDADLRHWQFVYHSILDLNQELAPHNTQIHILYGEAKSAFEFIQSHYVIQNVFSHQETGNQISFQRDKAIAKFFKEKGITWHEFQNNGVIRGLQNRQEWDKQWEQTMQKPICKPQISDLQTVDFTIADIFHLPETLKNVLQHYPKTYQPAGEKYAWKYLKTFFKERAKGYTKFISKPTESRYHCSRLSPYLSWGNLSSRQVFQAYLQEQKNSPFSRDLQNFRSRLQWRCHFIQKFESECRMEFEPLNKAYLTLKQEINEDYIQAWQEARTGFPLVDACMRAVKETGYLNFRMRAMLVSFLTHLLWQPWHVGVHFLARQFLDYEIGIHFPQFQMQAGVWGTNTIRIYNPTKQSIEQDNQGIFIRKWLPELQKVPDKFIHEPSKMTFLEQMMYDCHIGKTYPAPIIDLKTSSKHAADVLWAYRKKTEVIRENQRILAKHVKPKSTNAE